LLVYKAKAKAKASDSYI